MAKNDLYTCAQLLSKMLDKDSVVASSRGAVRRCASAQCNTSSLTTGRIAKGKVIRTCRPALNIEGKKSRLGKKYPRSPTTVIDGALRGDHGLQKDCGLGGGAQESDRLTGSRVVNSEAVRSCSRRKQKSVPCVSRSARQAPTDSSCSELMSPMLEKPVLFNHRLASSTPAGTPPRVIKRDGALMMNSSTGTQIINLTDDVMALRPNQKLTNLVPQLSKGAIEFAPNPSYTGNVGSVGGTNQSELAINHHAVLSAAKFLRENTNNVYDARTLSESPLISPTKTHMQSLLNRGGGNYENKVTSDAERKIAFTSARSDSRLLEDRRVVANSTGKEQKEFKHLKLKHLADENRNEICCQLPVCDVNPANGLSRNYISQTSPCSNVNKSIASLGLHNAQWTSEQLSVKAETVGKVSSSHSSDISQECRGAAWDPKDSIQAIVKRISKNEGGLTNKYFSGRKTQDNMDRTGPTGCTSNVASCEMKSTAARSDVVTGLLAQLKDKISESRNAEINRLIAELQDVVTGFSVTASLGSISGAAGPAQFEVDTSPLQSHHSNTKDREEVAASQLRKEDEHMWNLHEGETSEEVRRLVLINERSDQEIQDLRRENEELQRQLNIMKQELEKIRRDKADLLHALDQKDDDHMKSLQEKARDVRLVQAELEVVRGEKLGVEKLLTREKELVERQQTTLRQKEEEMSHSQELVRSLRQSMTRLVCDLQNSRSLSTPTSKHFIESLHSVQDQLNQHHVPTTGSAVEADPHARIELVGHLSAFESVRKHTGSHDQRSAQPMSNARKSLDFPPVSNTTNHLSDRDIGVDSRGLLGCEISTKSQLPSNVEYFHALKVHDNLNRETISTKSTAVDRTGLVGRLKSHQCHDYNAPLPLVRSNQKEVYSSYGMSAECLPDDVETLHDRDRKRSGRIFDEMERTLTDVDINQDLIADESFREDNSSASIEQSRHSLAEYFRKYPSDILSSFGDGRKINEDESRPRGITGIVVDEKSFQFVPLREVETFTVTNSISTGEPAISIRMSDFSSDDEETDRFSDQPLQSSDVDCNDGIRMGNAGEISPILRRHVIGVRHDIVRSESAASLASVTSSEDMAFRDDLASLDANIVRIQQQLKADLERSRTLTDSSEFH